jgi:glycosyltransferase involved in cell wall biosynthesis
VRKFERRLDKIIEYWANYDAGQAILAGNEVKYVAGMAPSTKIFDLSLIIPTHNNGEGVLDLLETLFAELASPGFSFEVIVVDDASTDEVTKDALLDFAARNESNFYLLSTKSPSGAGRARNLAIPLVEGRFVYFADADDNYDFAALRSAVQYAFASGSDLVLLPYAVEHVHSNNESSVQDHMLPSDERIWTRIKERGNRTTKEDLKKEALSLINYPWKQITSSELIFTADVFFGPTIVHNDVQFHWTSIAAANKIGVYFDKKVCTHRKFDPSVRGQLTSVKDEKRMGVFNAIHFTQRALALAGILDQDESLVLSLWKDFVQKLLKWAFKQIPQSLKSDFQEKQMALWNQLRAAPRIRKGHPLPYWKTLYP